MTSIPYNTACNWLIARLMEKKGRLFPEGMVRADVLAGILALVIPATVVAKTQNGDSALVEDPVALVNPFTDTHDSRWFYFSSASRPFGMVNLSPDTDTDSKWHSGYLYGSSHIRCFSHIHGWQLAGVPVMPMTGRMKGHLGMDEYQSEFRHEGEVAMPGYHRVYLDDYETEVELTSTTRVGFHRYRFTDEKERHVVFDVGAFLAHGPTRDALLRRVDDHTLEGYMLLAPSGYRKKTLKVFFYARFDKRIQDFGGWKKRELFDDPGNEIRGRHTGGYVSFSPGVDQVKLKVAVSYTSVENARFNLEHELPHWDFDRVKKESVDEWNRWLSRIRVSGGTQKQRVKFYTDLWHALQGRRIVSDANGYYIDNTGVEPVIRRVEMKDGKPVHSHYNFDSMWGSHWSINILWSMVYPELMDGFCRTMIDMYRNGGQIPRGPAGGDYTYIMTGDPATAFFACAWNKGIRNYDMETAYEGLLKSAYEEGIRDSAVNRKAHLGSMRYYLERGYVPEGVLPGKDRGATLTLEYAYNDWCLSQLSLALGREEDYRELTGRACNYRNLWNPESGYMHPREKDGSWIRDFSPVARAKTTRGFQEANASVYTHFVPHDIAGLAGLFGGQSAYNEALNAAFEKAQPHGFVSETKKMHATAWVNYGNEPGHGMAHIFNHSGAPYLSQKWVRKVKYALGDTSVYGGYNGDEDQGKGGALGVLMAIGMFQLNGGASVKPFYEITAPVFDSVVIRLDPAYYPGGEFVIETRDNSKENMYIESAKLNGEPLDRCWFYHEDFARGGKLELQLGPEPNRSWGTGTLPPSLSREKSENINKKDYN